MSNPAYTVVTDPVAGQEIRVIGDPTQITLSSRNIKRVPFGFETLETFGATSITMAKAFQNDCLLDERCIDCEIEQVPPDITIKVRWAFDRTDTSWSTQQSEISWELDLLEASKPLSSHPYFANVYISPDWMSSEIANADSALATGQEYTASGVFKVWMQRYAGLRGFGVDEWNPLLPLLVKRTRIYTSSQAHVWANIYANINRAFATAELPEIPDEISAAIAGIKVVQYPAPDGASGGSVDPASTSQANFFWVKKAPKLAMAGKNPHGPRDITETYMGAQLVSAVLYPAASGTCAALGLWDPKSS